MNLSAHAAVGALVGSYTSNPVMGLIAGIISHHISDFFPHTDGGSLNVDVKDFAKDRRILLIVSIDFILLVLITLSLIIYANLNSPMIFGAIGGVIPDLLDNMPFWSPQLRKTIFGKFYHQIHEIFHYTIENKKVLWTGVINQLILIAISLRLLI